MYILNLFASPSSGKSTTAAYIFSQLKMHTEKKVELVGEYAKELIYRGNEVQLSNQIYLMGNQYRKLKDLERNGIEICISDSPLSMQLAYCKHLSYYPELAALSNKLNEEFNNINIFIKRVKKYQGYGRTQTEEESDKLAKEIWDARNGDFDIVVEGNQDGCDELMYFIMKKLVTKSCTVCKKPLDFNKDYVVSVGAAIYCSLDCSRIDVEDL